MSIWTREELGRLNTALIAKDNDAIQTLTNLYKQRTNMAVLKSNHPVLIAVQENNSALLQYFLTSQNIDLKTLYHCIELCLVKNHKEIFQILTSKENQSKLGINLNYTIQVHQSLFPQSYGQIVSISILRLAITCAKQHNDYKILEILLSQQNLKIDQTISTSTLSNCTELMLACLKQPPEKRDMTLIRLLIKAGADPYIQAEGNGTTISVMEYIEAVLHANPRDSEANEIMSLIKTELKNRGNRGRDSSPEHSSDSTLSTPRSAGSFSGSPKDGSPNGSPPHQSVMGRYSPSDMRNDSPPGSPSLSDNASAGSSPEKVSGARDHDVHTMIMKGANIEEIKKIYDAGRVTFECSCSDCTQLATNVLHDILRFKNPDMIDLAKYLLDHPKYPVSINIKNRNGQTYLHFIAKLKFAADNQPLEKFQNHFLNYGDRYNIDVNVKDKNGNTPLHLAGANGNAELVAELLKHNADCTLTNNEGLTPYEYASRECKDLQKKSAVLAVIPKEAITVSSSLANSVSNRFAGSSPEKVSGARDHDVHDMLMKGVDVNIIKEIYDAGGVTFNCRCSFCLKHKVNVMRDVLRYDHPNKINLTKYMLNHSKYPASINLKTHDNLTYLHWLAIREFEEDNEPLEKLQNHYRNYGDEYFIDINAKNGDGNTALHLAGANGNSEFISELLRHKADYSIKNNEGLTPYEYASRECKDLQKKSAVLAVIPKEAIAVSSSLANRNTPSSSPIVINKTPVVQQAATGNAANTSNIGIFATRSAPSLQPALSPAQRAQPKQIGAMHVPPPLTVAQLPKPFKKPDMIIEPPSAVVHTDNKKSTSNVVDKLKKGILGK